MKRLPLFILLNALAVMANTKDVAFMNRMETWTGDEVETFSQLISHDSPSMGTFNQNYWVNANFATNAHSPNILYICGEATCHGPANAVVSTARDLGAHIFTLEHRYYGASMPVKNLETQNLKYLSVKEALLDLVTFKKAMTAQMGLTGKWIVVGGSYAGALAAYLRSTYPLDFAGALSSSGPVMADFDFSEYDAHVAKVAGKDCQAAILSVVAKVEKSIVSDKGFAAEKKFFGVKNLKLREDFLYLLADAAAGAVQYGLKDQFCQAVVKNGRTGYAKGVALVSRMLGNLEEMSAQSAEDTSLVVGQEVGMRQWFYQSCTELGYWQNVNKDAAKRARSVKINADYHNAICKRLFGIQASSVTATNKKYYEPLLLPTSSNVFYTNGEEDPWSNLSITSSTNKNISTKLIKGAAHCDDLSLQATPEVMAAQVEFLVLAKKWTEN
jgi:hypothetical protein